MFLEWWLPERDLDKVQMHWDPGHFAEVSERISNFVLWKLRIFVSWLVSETTITGEDEWH